MDDSTVDSQGALLRSGIGRIVGYGGAGCYISTPETRERDAAIAALKSACDRFRHSNVSMSPEFVIEILEQQVTEERHKQRAYRLSGCCSVHGPYGTDDTQGRCPQCA